MAPSRTQYLKDQAKKMVKKNAPNPAPTKVQQMGSPIKTLGKFYGQGVAGIASGTMGLLKKGMQGIASPRRRVRSLK